MEDQITIVAVATRHEKNRGDRHELPPSTDLTLDFSAVALSTRRMKNSRKQALSRAKIAELEARSSCSSELDAAVGSLGTMDSEIRPVTEVGGEPLRVHSSERSRTS